MVELLLIAAQLVVAVQLAWLLRALEAMRVEISSARWEWGRMVRLAAYKRDEGLETIGGHGADGLD